MCFVCCDSNGRYLVSGGTDGCVYGWDISSVGGEGEQDLSPHKEEEEQALQPLLRYQAHADAVNGTRQARLGIRE